MSWKYSAHNEEVLARRLDALEQKLDNVQRDVRDIKEKVDSLRNLLHDMVASLRRILERMR